jgi:hypothetical protein
VLTRRLSCARACALSRARSAAEGGTPTPPPGRERDAGGGRFSRGGASDDSAHDDALALAAARSQAAVVERAREELSRKLSLGITLPAYPYSPAPAPPQRAAAPPQLLPRGAGASDFDASEESCGFSTEGAEAASDSGSVLARAAPRSALSPRAARHPAARRRAAERFGDATAPSAAAAAEGGRSVAAPSSGAGAASARRSQLQLARRRKRELEKIIQNGSADEVEAANAELPAVQAALARCVRRARGGVDVLRRSANMLPRCTRVCSGVPSHVTFVLTHACAAPLCIAGCMLSCSAGSWRRRLRSGRRGRLRQLSQARGAARAARTGGTQPLPPRRRQRQHDTRETRLRRTHARGDKENRS